MGFNYKRRRAQVREAAARYGADSLLVTTEENITYLSGFTGHDAVMLIGKNRNFFFTDARYAEEAEKTVLGFEIVQPKESLLATIGQIASNEKLRRIGFESANLPYAVYKKMKSFLKLKKLVPLTEAVEDARSVKDAQEIRLIENAISLTGKVFNRVTAGMKSEDTEASLAREIKTAFIVRGASAAFEPIVASGRNSSKPHAAAANKRIGNCSFIMLDLGCRIKGYCSDMTRTLRRGKTPILFNKIYSIVEKAHSAAIKKVRPGIAANEIDAAARAVISSAGYGKFFGHSTGHGIGLDVHEKPRISHISGMLLKAGMVFTIEPAIYLPGFGGVRIEDVVCVTADGCRVLTR